MSEDKDITVSETSIAFKESDKADCELEIVLDIDDENAIRGSIPMPFGEAMEFIDALKKELTDVSVKKNTKK